MSLINSLITLPFNHATDFTELADNCERFTDALVDCEEPAPKMALYGRLYACLNLPTHASGSCSGRFKSQPDREGTPVMRSGFRTRMRSAGALLSGDNADADERLTAATI